MQQRLVRKKENNMGRKQMFLVLGLVMVMGLAVYLRLWTIDYHFSSTETELLRRQFDLASREAMDESAMWRKRFDDEEDKSSTCQKELNKIKQSLKEDGAAATKKKLDLLQKENIDLLERLESLKQELESEKLKCSMKQKQI
ncbi:hypothetical protein BC332_23056 [Capsicum chinense]|uniref:Uncharacterized protein n=1 Tax=Capsicum annuum TaxID=4072 RepID=A0A1U8EQ74_CAPAN|nr:uncharacterized protein LOC107846017 [Capsicum annuum]KAF3652767.1 putative auxin response factor 18-like isoform X1 [Capsicum annuum]PHT71888.1 hypothetical protein T459_22673 [Capsicum annuum]PHU06567.1 hypothetical protein BC332_23056 [Capsicum chinense]